MADTATTTANNKAAYGPLTLSERKQQAGETQREAEQRAYAAPIGEAIVWNNPNSGNSGTVTPVRDGRSTAGSYCREFQTEVTVGGQREKAHGVACQQPDGSWRIVEG
jgi:surface antigen